MQYQLAPLFCRPWTLNGMTPRLIESHYERNYGGELRRLNAISRELDSLDPVTQPEAIARLKRDEAAALNSALLHELYFASLGGHGMNVPEAMAEALARDFGSVKAWRQQFVALAGGLPTGSGWVLLTWLPRERRLFNVACNEGTPGLAGGVPILALDLYEHAYHIDFGANTEAYIATFMRNIDWVAVQGRYEDATKLAPPRPLEQKEFADTPAVSPEEVQAMVEAGQPVQIIDTRPRHFTTRAEDIMEGAVWRDPDRLEDWIGELKPDVPVVTFCVYGFHIGCQMAIALRKAGFDARYMSAGHSDWKAIGGKVRRFDEENRP